jgi:hypothetical protein
MYNMKFSSSLVKPENSLKVKKLVADISNVVKEQLKDIPLDNQKIDPDIILFIANQIENSFDKSKSVSHEKINKKDIFIQILKKVIPSIQPHEEQIILSILEHLHSSGMIKKITSWRFVKGISRFLFKKVLV